MNEQFTIPELLAYWKAYRKHLDMLNAQAQEDANRQNEQRRQEEAKKQRAYEQRVEQAQQDYQQDIALYKALPFWKRWRMQEPKKIWVSLPCHIGVHTQAFYHHPTWSGFLDWLCKQDEVQR